MSLSLLKSIQKLSLHGLQLMGLPLSSIDLLSLVVDQREAVSHGVLSLRLKILLPFEQANLLLVSDELHPYLVLLVLLCPDGLFHDVVLHPLLFEVVDLLSLVHEHLEPLLLDLLGQLLSLFHLLEVRSMLSLFDLGQLHLLNEVGLPLVLLLFDVDSLLLSLVYLPLHLVHLIL